jgi:hypothetical protein
MKSTHCFFILCSLTLLSFRVVGQEQDKPIVVSSLIGDTLDAGERERYKLVPNLEGFQWAVFYLNPDSSLKVKVSLLDNKARRDTIIERYRTLKGVQNQVQQFVEAETVRGIYSTGVESRPAQPEERSAWLNGGLGGGSTGPSVGLSFSYRVGSNLISVRGIYSEEFEIMGPSPSEWVMDIGVLYGVNAKASYGIASLSGGVSLVRGVRRGRYLGSSGGWFGTSNYEKLSYSTFGIPIEGQLFWTPSSDIGFGVSAYADSNPERSFAGALLCLQIGGLW